MADGRGKSARPVADEPSLVILMIVAVMIAFLTVPNNMLIIMIDLHSFYNQFAGFGKRAEYQWIFHEKQLYTLFFRVSREIFSGPRGCDQASHGAFRSCKSITLYFTPLHLIVAPSKQLVNGIGEGVFRADQQIEAQTWP
jgi:hypothetical protein